MPQDVIQPQGQFLLLQASEATVVRWRITTIFRAWAKSCAHQQTTAGLQTVEEEAGVMGMPGHMPGNLYVLLSAVFWLHRAAGAAGFSLFDAQQSSRDIKLLLHPHLSGTEHVLMLLNMLLPTRNKRQLRKRALAINNRLKKSHVQSRTSLRR